MISEECDPELLKKCSVEGLRCFFARDFGDGRAVAKFKTPNGTTFHLAKDYLGTHFCLSGNFWPSTDSFPSMRAAVDFLRENTQSAVEFFDKCQDTQ